MERPLPQILLANLFCFVCYLLNSVKSIMHSKYRSKSSMLITNLHGRRKPKNKQKPLWLTKQNLYDYLICCCTFFCTYCTIKTWTTPPPPAHTHKTKNPPLEEHNLSSPTRNNKTEENLPRKTKAKNSTPLEERNPSSPTPNKITPPPPPP